MRDRHRRAETRRKGRRRHFPICNPDVAGIDISPRCIYVAVPRDRDPENVRCFGAFTQDLKALVKWLKVCRIRSVAMESTGVYWIPLYQILADEGMEVYLVNARHVKHVPGRKSDVSDAQWLQYLHSVGLLRGSFRPPQDICALRSIARHRESLLKMAVMHVQHMQKALDQMNVHLHRVIDDITGKTGLAIVEAILSGERNPIRLAQLRNGRIKADEATIARALEGDYRDEHLFVLAQSLEAWKQAQQQILSCDRELERLTLELEVQVQLNQDAYPRKTRKRSKNQPQGDWHRLLHQAFGVDLTAVPAIEVATVQTLLVELGTNWSCFPTAGHFASWLTLCPDNEISGGKVLRRKTRRAQQRVKRTLRVATQSLHRSKSLLGAKYRALRARLGASKAITAMAHKLARILWYLVTYKIPYDESVFARSELNYQNRRKKRLQAEIRAMGFQLVPLPTGTH